MVSVFHRCAEVSGAIGLLIPKVRFWAALQIAVVMVGGHLHQYRGFALADHGAGDGHPAGVGACFGLAASSRVEDSRDLPFRRA